MNADYKSSIRRMTHDIDLVSGADRAAASLKQWIYFTGQRLSFVFAPRTRPSVCAESGED